MLQRAEEIACKWHGLKSAKLNDRTRERDYAFTRHIIAYLIRGKYRLSYAAIGKMLGKNHASIINAIRRVKDYCFENQKFANWLKQAVKEMDENHDQTRRENLIEIIYTIHSRGYRKLGVDIDDYVEQIEKLFK